jgi:site-specific DNA-methyltransferase (adenine-specific)
MFSFVGETVLDPFLGTGTTSVCAKNLNRNSVGIEINNDFIPLIKRKFRKFESESPMDFDINIKHLDDTGIDFNSRIKGLPYIFKDPHQLEKKINPKQKSFGSRIKSGDKKHNTYYTIKKILGPEKVLLNDNLKVKLIGVQIKAGKKKEAIEFLTEKTRSQKLIVKFDDNLAKDIRSSFAYLFLKNKTFLNAQLIKTGLATAVTKNDYKYQKMFKKYEDLANQIE